MSFFFFFQAEDGIRDLYVTGVQTCALTISPEVLMASSSDFGTRPDVQTTTSDVVASGSARYATSGASTSAVRSEERRVGKAVDLGGGRRIKKKKREKESADEC